MGGIYKRDHTILSIERWQMVIGNKKFGVVSHVLVGGSGGNLCIFPLPGLHFVRFLKQIFGYAALHYSVDRPNLQLSSSVVCLCKYHNSVTNLFCLDFQQYAETRNRRTMRPRD